MDVLAQAGAVSLLYLIYKRKEITTVAFSDELPGGFDRLKSVAISLKEAGLVEIRTIERPHRIRKYCLTEKGKMVAEKLAEVEEIMRA